MLEGTTPCQQLLVPLKEMAGVFGLIFWLPMMIRVMRKCMLFGFRLSTESVDIRGTMLFLLQVLVAINGLWIQLGVNHLDVLIL